jgi:hypothetical protein
LPEYLQLSLPGKRLIIAAAAGYCAMFVWPRFNLCEVLAAMTCFAIVAACIASESALLLLAVAPGAFSAGSAVLLGGRKAAFVAALVWCEIVGAISVMLLALLGANGLESVAP